MNRHQHLGWKGKLCHVSGFSTYLATQVQDIVMTSDLILFQRNLTHPSTLDAVMYFQGLGKPVIVHLDDGYQMLPWSNPARQFWFNNPSLDQHGQTYPGGALEMMTEGVRLAHGLTCPNRLLLEDWRVVSGKKDFKGYYLQNYAEPSWWLGLPSSDDTREGRQHWGNTWWREPSGEVRGMPSREWLKKKRKFEGRTVIGWGGSISHIDGWHGSGLREAARRVTNRHPELLWMICGNDDRVAGHLPVPTRNKVIQGGVPPALWPRTVHCFDVGLAPLFGIYDQRRSWIKGIEYALGGVPWIGTEGEPYRDISDWPTGMLGPETPGFWEDALEDMLAHLKDRQEQAVALQGEARQRFLVDNNLDEFARVFRQAIQDFNDETTPLPNVMWIGPPNGKGG